MENRRPFVPKTFESKSHKATDLLNLSVKSNFALYPYVRVCYGPGGHHVEFSTNGNQYVDFTTAATAQARDDLVAFKAKISTRCGAVNPVIQVPPEMANAATSAAVKALFSPAQWGIIFPPKNV